MNPLVNNIVKTNNGYIAGARDAEPPGHVQVSTPYVLYRFFDHDSQLLYIGITLNPSQRWVQHRDRKPWWSEVASITLEVHPDRQGVLQAEIAAIRSEQPRYNLMHNRQQWPRPEVAVRDPKQGRWTFKSISGGLVRQCDLHLYPELDCSAMVDDYWDLDGAGQFEAYVDYLKRHHSAWLAADAVPIYWSVRSDQGGVKTETAPFQSTAVWPYHQHFLSYYTWPVDAGTGELLDWYALPVLNNRFPQFAEALAWTPSPLQPTCPLASILRSRRGIPPRLNP